MVGAWCDGAIERPLHTGNGIELPPNPLESQAASRGDVDALFYLGLMLKSGEFVAPDCEKAEQAFKQVMTCDDV